MKRMIMCLMAVCCLTVANAQGKYPNGAWQSSPESKNTAEGVIYTKKAKGQASEGPETVCNGELTIEAPNGWREYYVLTYTGAKQPAGYVFNVKMVDTDMIEITGKVTIRQYGDESKTQPYIMVKAISPNLKKKLINNTKLMMVFTNGAGIP